MYKKLFIFLLIFGISLTTMMVLTPSKPEPLPMTQLIPNKSLSAEQILEKYNKDREKIKNFTCIQELWVKGIKLDGSIFYEKPHGFRMFTTSIVGLESDIGANSTHFWFWSRRYNPLNLYYAKHEDLNDTYLRTPFNPYWIKELLGIDPIDLKDAQLYSHEGNYVIMKPGTNAQGKPVIKSYVYDPKLETIVAYYLYNKNYQPILTLKIENQECGLVRIPKKITLHWHEENTNVTWIFNNVKLDSQIESDIWLMPHNYNKINLKGYLPKAFLTF